MDSEAPPPVKAEVERRQYRRVKLITQVQCEALERNEVMVTRDVSAGGMFVTSRFPFPLDSEVSLTFRLHPKGPPIVCRAKVRFSQSGVGMGIQFLDLSAGMREVLQKFVDEGE